VRLEQNRAVLVDQLKTSGSVRRLAVGPDVAEVLRAQRAATEGELCFPNAVGGPLDPPKTRRKLTAACERITRARRTEDPDADAFPNVSPNELRHTAATLLVARGAPLAAVADHLGHADVSMLAAVYRHRSEGVQTLAVDYSEERNETG